MSVLEKRNRHWSTIVYEESTVENWINVLDEQNVPILISPLHDKDLNVDGTVKKAHYHVILSFDGQKTRTQAMAIFELVNGVGIERIESIKGYSRYLVHADNPEKAQYNPKDVIALSGANYETAIMIPEQKYKIIGEIIEYCMDNDINSYSEILLFAKNEKSEWFPILCDNSHTITQFLKSKVWYEKRSCF